MSTKLRVNLKFQRVFDADVCYEQTLNSLKAFESLVSWSRFSYRKEGIMQSPHLYACWMTRG